MDATFPNLQSRSPEKESAFVARIVLQNRHHENKRPKSASPNTASTSKCPPETADGARTKNSCRGRTARQSGVWLQLTNCVFYDNRFARERAHSRNTRFCLTQSSIPPTKHFSAFSGSQVNRERKLIESIHILVENLDKVLASRVKISLVSANLIASLLPYFSPFPAFPLARRATCFKTCFVNTPRQRNLTPF